MIGEKTESMALLTQMSIGPNVRSTSSAACSTAFSSATSSGSTIASPPSSSISRFAPSSPSLPRAISPTFAPRFPNARAAARPTPADAPVMTTTSGDCMLIQRARPGPVLQVLAAAFGRGELGLIERQHHEERRAGADGAVDDDLSGVLADDLLDNRQTESRSAALFCGEQRLENVFENLGSDSGTAVAHKNGGEAARLRQALAKEGDVVRAQGADRDDRSRRRGVARIADQVQYHLRQLRGVGPDHQRLGWSDIESLLAQTQARFLAERAHPFARVDWRQPWLGGAGEAEDLMTDRPAALHAVADIAERFRIGRIAADLPFKDFDERLNRHEHV